MHITDYVWRFYVHFGTEWKWLSWNVSIEFRSKVRMLKIHLIDSGFLGTQRRVMKDDFKFGLFTSFLSFNFSYLLFLNWVYSKELSLHFAPNILKRKQKKESKTIPKKNNFIFFSPNWSSTYFTSYFIVVFTEIECRKIPNR